MWQLIKPTIHILCTDTEAGAHNIVLSMSNDIRDVVRKGFKKGLLAINIFPDGQLSVVTSKDNRV